MEMNDQSPRVNSQTLFFMAVLILFIVLLARFFREDLRYDMIYLVTLSLSVSMVFAFLPLSIEVNHKWVKAAGTAGIFIACLASTLYFAHSMLVRDQDRMERDQNETQKQAVEQQLSEQISDKDKQLLELRTALEKSNTEKSGNDAQSTLLKQSVDSAILSLAGINHNLDEARQFASAAQSNYSDSRTCSTRAGQSLDKMAPVFTDVASLTSSLQNARSVTK